MTKKLIYLIVGAMFAFGLLFLLWAWLFSGGGKTQTTGQFGTSTDATQGIGVVPGATNGQANYGQNSANGTITLGNNGKGTTGTGSNGATGGNGTNANFTSFTNTGGTNGTLGSAHGVTWLGSPFNPTGINSISSGASGFTPNITSQTGGSGNGGTSMIEALAATAIAGSLTCAIQAGIITISGIGTAGSASAGAGGSLALSATGLPVADFGAHTALIYIAGQQTTQTARNVAHDSSDFAHCIINTIAKVALQQITISVVNWINSGFSGQPSFITNYQQFFTNVADLAAGQFIQGSALSFLCSPFKLQIKIAVAQSYANRGAQSCSLTKIIKNVDSFMSGNFSQGGWQGMLSFTSVPTNNPYGAYSYAQVGLVSAQNNALANAKSNISPTGFLNLQKISGCTDSSQNGISAGVSIGTNPQAAAAAGSAALPPGCKTTVVTPGGAIADSLGAVSKSGVDQLGLASDIDQIINALTTQLMVRMLQNGLPSLSQSTTQTPADIAAQSQATALLNDMQSKTTIAQQLGTIYQGSINDIQGAQAGLNGLANCWSSIANATQASIAAQNAAAASSTIQSLENQVTTYNNDITQVNSAIAAINQFELQISTAASAADVSAVTASYNAAVSAGTFPLQTDLTTAQQNRTTLQSQMATINATTQNGMAQCQALGQ